MDTIIDLEGSSLSNSSTEKLYRLTPLHVAGITGDLAATRSAIMHEPKLLDLRDSRGTSALQWAITLGYEEIAEELLNANADPVSYHERSLLQCVVDAELGRIVKLLVECPTPQDLPLSKEEETGQNLLTVVINRDSTLTRHLLKEENVGLHLWDIGLGTALSWAVRYRDVELVGQLVARGADISHGNYRSGGTVLHEATEISCYSMVKFLLGAGAKVNLKDNGIWTPLDIAVRQDDARITKILLDYGGRIDGEFGWSALLNACKAGQLHSINLLTENGISSSNFKFEDIVFYGETTAPKRSRTIHRAD